MTLYVGMAYELTGQVRFKEMAKDHFDFLFEDARVEDGIGLWEVSALNHDHPLNEIAVCTMAPASLAAYYIYKIYDDQDYLDKAILLYDWSRELLFNEETGQVYNSIAYERDQDPVTGRYYGLHKEDAEPYLRDDIFTYNPGWFIGNANALYNATGDESYLADAQLALQHIVNDTFHFDGNGLVVTPSQFHGYFFRWTATYIFDQNLGQEYMDWLQANADMAWANRHPETNQTGRNLSISPTDSDLLSPYHSLNGAILLQYSAQIGEINAAYAQAVVDQIDQIMFYLAAGEDPSDVAPLVVEAEADYAALTADQQNLVDNYSNLQTARDFIAAIAQESNGISAEGLPWHVQLTVTERDDQYTDWQDRLADLEDGELAALYSIELTDLLTGLPYELTGEIVLTFPVPAGYSDASWLVLHWLNSDTLETLQPEIAADGLTMSVTITSLSDFGLVATTEETEETTVPTETTSETTETTEPTEGTQETTAEDEDIVKTGQSGPVTWTAVIVIALLGLALLLKFSLRKKYELEDEQEQ